MAGVTVHEAEIMARENLSAMKREYTRMRDMAQKRIQRLGAGEFAETKAYTSHTFKEYDPKSKKYVDVPGFQKLRNIDPADFATAYSELSKFIGAKGSTIGGQKAIQAKTIGTINKATGADAEEEEEETAPPKWQLTRQNYWRFIKILNESRRRKVVYDSEKMVALSEQTLVLNNDQFDDVLDNLDKMIEHSDEIERVLNDAKGEESTYTEVNIDSLIEQIGW